MNQKTIRTIRTIEEQNGALREVSKKHYDSFDSSNGFQRELYTNLIKSLKKQIKNN